jgi:peptidoglycan/xylan/chitin deacetylase (PgdA/CDA1 family)
VDLDIPEFKVKTPILTYHKVDKKFEPGITRVTPAQFERQMRFLYSNGYKSITLSEARRSESAGRFVAITFDDGYQNIFEYAYPILRRLGFRATVFLITGFIGRENSWDFNFGFKFRHLDWDQIKVLLEAGWEIGSHTVNHLDLTMLSDEEIKFELETSKHEIESKLGVKVSLLALPFGRFDERIIRYAKIAGYEDIYGDSNATSKNSIIPRKSVYLFDSIRSLERKLNDSKFELMKLKLINSFSILTPLVKQKFRKVGNVIRGG